MNWPPKWARNLKAWCSIAMRCRGGHARRTARCGAVTDTVRAASPTLQALPVLEDLRGRFQDRREAHRWAIKELLPSCSQDGAFSITHGIDVWRSMWRSRKDVRLSTESLRDAALIGEILDHLHPISPVLGVGRRRRKSICSK